MKNQTAAHSNDPIEALYKLTAEEQKLILCLISLIQPMDESADFYIVSIKDFMELSDIKDKGAYKQLKAVSAQLMSKPLIFKKEDAILIVNWLSSIEYYEELGKIEIRFNPKLKPYLLKLKDNYAANRLQHVITFKSVYSIRIQELLRQHERKGEKIFTLKDLRDHLCIDENLYPMYSNLKQKVLNVAHKELKEKSDIFFEYEEIKLNKKVEKLKFVIHTKASVSAVSTQK